MTTAVALYSVAIVLTAASALKDRKRTLLALKKSLRIFLNILPDVMTTMLFVGLSLSVLSPQVISSVIGEQSGVFGVIVSAVVGSVAMLPSFIVFPLGAMLVQNGAGLSQAAALMTTLMSVGFVTLPVESKIFGKKFAYLRNAAGIVMALLFALVVWRVMA